MTATKRERRKARPIAKPATLSIDIGGSGIKASVLDANGKRTCDFVRVWTGDPEKWPMIERRRSKTRAKPRRKRAGAAAGARARRTRRG